MSTCLWSVKNDDKGVNKMDILEWANNLQTFPPFIHKLTNKAVWHRWSGQLIYDSTLSDGLIESAQYELLIVSSERSVLNLTPGC